MAEIAERQIRILLTLESRVAKAIEAVDILSKLNKIGLTVSKSGKSIIDMTTKQRVSFSDLCSRIHAAKIKNKLFSDETQKTQKSMEKLNKTMKGFWIWLPLMFGFQQIGNAMKSVIDPAMQLAGVNELYQEFLALKYLPTALEQLDNVMELGEAWMNESEESRKAEGDMLLATQRMIEMAEYTSQTVLMFQALGRAIPGVGESIGTFIGLTVGLSSSLWAVNDESGKTIASVGGLGDAILIKGNKPLMAFLDKIGLFTDEKSPKFQKELDSINENLSNSVPFYDELTNAINRLIESFERLSGESGKVGGEVGGKVGKGGASFTEKAKRTGMWALLGGIGGGVVGGVAGGLILGPGGILPGVLTGAKLGAATFGTIGALRSFQSGGIIPATGPYLLHAGETVIPAGGSKDIVLNVNYTINVSDRVQMENMIKENNKRLVEDVRRLIES